MKKEDMITKLSAYNFNEPVKVTVSFDDSDEDDNQSELLNKEVVLDPEKATKEKDEVTHKHESSGTVHKQEVAEKMVISEKNINSSIQSVKKDVQDLFSLIENYYSNGTVENEISDNNMAKKRKLETAQVETLQKETQQKDNYHTSKSDITVKHFNDNLVHQNSLGADTITAPNETHNENKSSTKKTTQKTNEERNGDTYVINLLKSVSEHLILIVEAYHCYQRTAKDKLVAERLKTLSHFSRIKEHFFNLSYCTVATIIIPQEENIDFMTTLISDTVKLSNNKFTYSQFYYILMEMLQWTKLKQKSLINLPIHFDTANSQQHAHNTELRQNLAQPMQRLESRVKHINNINLKQYLELPSKPLHTEIDHHNNNILNQSYNSSSTFSEHAPSLNNYISTENVTPGQSCIFSSGPPGRQISIKVNPVLLNQENRQAFSNLNSQISTTSKPRDCNINPYHKRTPWFSKNASPMNYQHQLLTDKTKAPLSQPVQPHYQNNYFLQNDRIPRIHGTLASQQMVPPSLPATIQPLPAAQPLSLHRSPTQPLHSAPPPSYEKAYLSWPYQAPVIMSEHNMDKQPMDKQSLQKESTEQQQTKTKAQPLSLHLSPTQPLHSVPPPSFEKAYNWTYQAPVIMSQQNMDKQPMDKQSLQKESTEQQKTETNRSVSTDSGFTSPLNFNSPEPMSDPRAQDQQNMQPTPFITHITSLNPAASYMVDSPCSICRKTTKKRCMGCFKIYYCSYGCQQADWNMHQHICKET